MDFASVKLVVADMDGTLLTPEHKLPQEFYAVFEKLRAKGILFAAASGRQYYNILKLFPGLEASILFIAENGSYVSYRDEELLVQAMNKETARMQLLEAKQFPNVYPILCGKKQAYIDNESPEFLEKMSLYYDRVKVVDDITTVDDDDFLKIALCDFKGAEQNTYQYFRKKEDILQVKVSGKIWLDLSDPLANKGRALRHVQQRFGISRDETMAFGDFLNDVEMLQESRFSYAMENAHPDVKKIARFQAGSNNSNGVLNVLRDVVSGS
jgi:Cof subfamily protein (haloacid dehalogenase superfamily)